jgi:NAD(P)H dehydrogenase (quinone)
LRYLAIIIVAKRKKDTVGKILVTGASGHIGKLTLQNLVARDVPATKLAALVRDPSKAEDLANLGIELHQGDYMDPSSLLRAFNGVSTLMLVSTHAFTDRKQAHANVVDAAVKSGVERIVFMPIIRKAGSDFSMREVTEEDLFTEKKIVSSGLAYTFVKHPPFLNTLPSFFGPKVVETGIRVPAGSGKVAPATREDLAEAHGAILTQPGHENKTYTLTGSPAVSFAEMAEIISKITGKKVPLLTVSDNEYIETMVSSGIPNFVAPFLLDWVKGINRGEWDNVTGDLEKLIGRKPVTTEEYFRTLFANSALNSARK